MIENDSAKMFGLEFLIEKFEEKDSIKAQIIYLIVANTTSTNQIIKMNKALYITKDREQIDQDFWLPGYIDENDNLRSNTFKKAGLAFYKSKLKSISLDDSIIISIELSNIGKQIEVTFKNSIDGWKIKNAEYNDIKVSYSTKQLEKLLRNKIDRIDIFEEKLKVQFEKISVRLDNRNFNLRILGELHAVNETNIQCNILLKCVIIDFEGNILKQSNAYIYKEFLCI